MISLFQCQAAIFLVTLSFTSLVLSICSITLINQLTGNDGNAICLMCFLFLVVGLTFADINILFVTMYHNYLICSTCITQTNSNKTELHITKLTKTIKNQPSTHCH